MNDELSGFIIYALGLENLPKEGFPYSDAYFGSKPTFNMDNLYGLVIGLRAQLKESLRERKYLSIGFMPFTSSDLCNPGFTSVYNTALLKKIAEEAERRGFRPSKDNLYWAIPREIDNENLKSVLENYGFERLVNSKGH